MKRSVLINPLHSLLPSLIILYFSVPVLAQEQITKPVTPNQSSSWAPFKMVSFDAFLDNSTVNLNWSKVLEENTNSFIVERSIDGKVFNEIGVVFGDEKNNVSDFKYKDANVTSKTGLVFYRLKFVDEVKRLYYSETRLIRLSKSMESLQLTSFPNPVVNELRVTIPNAWQGKNIFIEIYSEFGIRMKVEKISNASQTQTLQVNALPKGIYIIKATWNSQEMSQRIIKS